MSDNKDTNSEQNANFLTKEVNGIYHEGIVQGYLDGIASVLVIRDSEGACSACGARDGCAAAASGKGKPSSVVEIPYPTALGNGQKVQVMLKANGDWKATIIAFVLPVVFMAGGLGIGYAVKLGELGTAFLSLGLLILYGLGLLAFRKQLKKTFEMSIVHVE